MSGYFDAGGNAYYYLTDYQGNVTGVIDSNAKIVQETGYYPYGEPWLEPEGDNPYLYGGKERVALGGVRYSDFGPRLLSTASGYWGSPGPLCEDSRDLSPYINCAANPVRYTDPTGMIIKTEMTDIEQKLYDDFIETTLRSSKLFASVYKLLDSSQDTYTVKFDQTLPTPGAFIVDDNGGGSVVLKIDTQTMEGVTTQSISTVTAAEEFFHALQHENRNYYVDNFNREFEARVFITAVITEIGTVCPDYNGMKQFVEDINVDLKYGNEKKPINIFQIDTAQFLSDYHRYSDTYAKYNRENNIGNNHYRVSSYPFGYPHSLKQTILNSIF